MCRNPETTIISLSLGYSVTPSSSSEGVNPNTSAGAANVTNPGSVWPRMLLNLLTGWTGIGWIAALVWATARKPAGEV
jgi:hypothetical protein